MSSLSLVICLIEQIESNRFIPFDQVLYIREPTGDFTKFSLTNTKTVTVQFVKSELIIEQSEDPVSTQYNLFFIVSFDFSMGDTL